MRDWKSIWMNTAVIKLNYFIDECVMEILDMGGVYIHLWSDSLKVKQSAMDQLGNISRNPVVAGHIAVMPDVVTKNPDQAYRLLLKYLNDNNLGFESERVLDSDRKSKKHIN